MASPFSEIRAQHVVFALGPGPRRFGDGVEENLFPILAAADPGEVVLYMDNDEEAPYHAPEGVPVVDAGDVGGGIGRALWAWGLARYVRRRRKSIAAVVLWNEPGRGAERLLRLAARSAPEITWIRRLTSDVVGPKSPPFGHVMVVPAVDARERIHARLPGGRAVRIPPPAAPPATKFSRKAVAARLGFDAGDFHLLFDGPIDRGHVLDHLAKTIPYLLLAEKRLHFHMRVREAGPLCRARAQDFYRKHLQAFCWQASLHTDRSVATPLWDMADAAVLPYEHHDGDGEVPAVGPAMLVRGRPVFLLRGGPWPELAPDALRDRVLAHKDPELGLRILEYAREPATIPHSALGGGAVFDPGAVWRAWRGLAFGHAVDIVPTAPKPPAPDAPFPTREPVSKSLMKD